MMLIGYVAVLDLGLNGAIIKLLAEYTAAEDAVAAEKLLRTTLLSHSVLGLVGGACIWGLAPWLSDAVFKVAVDLQAETVWSFRLTGVGFFLSMFVGWGSAIAAGLQRFGIVNGVFVLLATLVSVGGLLAALLGFGLVGVVTANVAANGVAAGMCFLIARRLLPNIRLSPSLDWHMFKRAASFGAHMTVFRVFSVLYNQMDRLLIGFQLGATSVAYYIVAYQVASLVQQLSGRMMQIIFPMSSELAATRDRERLKHLFLRAMNLCNVVGAGLAVPVIVLANPLLSHWMTPDFARNGADTLRLLAGSFYLMGLTVVPNFVLPGIGFPRVLSIGAVVTGTTSILFYSLFIQVWGISGVAGGAILSMVITNIYFLVQSRRWVGVSLLEIGRVVWGPVAVAVGIGIPAARYVVPHVGSLGAVVVSGTALLCMYGLACWLIGVFTHDERRALVSVMRHMITSTRETLQNRRRGGRASRGPA
jgi:O-antigen/teichoic acid export membrane protein